MTASKAGRAVNLDQILQHELMPVSLAAINGSLHIGSGGKSKLANELIQDISSPEQLTLAETTCLVIDDQALAPGKPSGVNTFGEYADSS